MKSGERYRRAIPSHALANILSFIRLALDESFAQQLAKYLSDSTVFANSVLYSTVRLIKGLLFSCECLKSVVMRQSRGGRLAQKELLDKHLLNYGIDLCS